MAKLGSYTLATLRKLGELGKKGFKASAGAIKSKFSGNGDSTPPSAGGEPQDES